MSKVDFFIDLQNGEIAPNYENNDCALLFNCDYRKLLKNIKVESIDLFCSDIPYKISTSRNKVRKNGENMLVVYLIVSTILPKI